MNWPVDLNCGASSLPWRRLLRFGDLPKIQLWQGKRLFLSILASFLLAIPLVCVRFGYDFHYVQAGDGLYVSVRQPIEYTIVRFCVALATF